MSGHVFISHSSENRDDAIDLTAFIEGHGVKCWMAPRDVRPGMDYSEQLQEAIEQCVAFVVLVTDMANKSPYVRAETEMAFSNHKPIFPFRNEDIKPAAGLAFFLKIRHWTDAFGKYRDDAMDRLALELKHVSGHDLDETEKTRLALDPSPGPVTTPLAAAPPATVDPPPPAPPAPPSQAPAAFVAAPPSPPPPAPAPVTQPPLPRADEEQLAAAVGPKADWYIARWRQMDAANSKTNWNWAACLANFYWLAYRKMWAGMILFFVASLVLGVIGSASPAAAKATLILNILMTFVTGYFGNHWYRMQTERLVAQTAGPDRPAQLEALRQRGGVSQPALFILLGISVLLVLLATAGAVMQQRRLLAQPQSNVIMPAPAPAPSPGGQVGTNPAPEPAAPPTLDEAYLVGRWSDDGNCSAAFEFTSDGRFIAANGAIGEWTLDGDQLTASGPGGTESMRLAPIDQNTMTATSPNGQTSNPIRC